MVAAGENNAPVHKRSILGVEVAQSDYAEVVQRSLQWAEGRESRALFFANVHVIMEAFDNPAYRALLNQADMVNPDGVPLVWALKALGETKATRVYGPDSTLAMLAAAEQAGIAVGFYGSSQAVMDALLTNVAQKHASLQVVFHESPPFRTLSPEEDEAVVQRISASGARVLFVGLGCPKQEAWIMEHRGKIPAVMFGVGAAFDFIAKTTSQAPRWMMRGGLEWAYRLACEPRRLGRRYLKHNPRFLAFFLQQLLLKRA